MISERTGDRIAITVLILLTIAHAANDARKTLGRVVLGRHHGGEQ